MIHGEMVTQEHRKGMQDLGVYTKKGQNLFYNSLFLDLTDPSEYMNLLHSSFSLTPVWL